jgi:hypothetical protein
LYVRNDMNKEIFYSVLGFGFLALFLATLLDPFPDKVTFRCDRSNGICVIETTDLYRSKTETINIDEIDHAYHEKFHGRGYRGPYIRLKNGNDRSLGIGKIYPFTTNEQNIADEINKFLSNPAQNHLAIANMRKIPLVILIAIFLFIGVFAIYKAMKPYILQGLNDK